MRSIFATLLDRLILTKPLWVLAVVAVLGAYIISFAPDIDLDASADSLLLEDDAELRYYRGIAARYGSMSYLVITYTAPDLFAPEALRDLQSLRDELVAVSSIDSVVTMLDVPLINSPNVTLAQLQYDVPTLLSDSTDLTLARTELTESSLYRELIMSRDGKTTALLVSFVQNPERAALLLERDALREKRMTTGLDAAESKTISVLSEQIQQINIIAKANEAESIELIRDILRQYSDRAELRLGGVPIIVADMIALIKTDVVVFGAGILVFLIVLLTYIFRQARWVFVSMTCCLLSALVVAGVLGLMQWRVTVVSSNFIALVVIFSLSLTVHLIVRYRELQRRNPQASQQWLLRNTLIDKLEPCFYTVLTTMVGFASLLVSGIRPVIDFGWMMVIGMATVFVVSFLLFPVMLIFMRPVMPAHGDHITTAVTAQLARWVRVAPGIILGLFLLAAVLSIIGISRLQVENRFLDYFAKSTEIYQGLAKIDSELGGTMPFDVILDADPAFYEAPVVTATADEGGGSDDEFGDQAFGDDPFGDDGFGSDDSVSTTVDLGATSYWYNSYQLQIVRDVHNYLDSLPETGKVLSMATALDALETLNSGNMPGTFSLSILYKQLPASIKEALIHPYMSDDGNQMRFSVRVYEANPDLRRGELLDGIRTHLIDDMGFEPEQVHVTGMLVLYNNVLQSLFKSQIMTIGVVFLAILFMYLVLFRSLTVAFVATVPSIVAATSVLGLMGWLGLSLDIMTITIAAITIGIGVDDSIHYVHRFREEIAIDGDPIEAMERSHLSIGRAIYYTSLVITSGFSILAISDFIPTIYFGLFTGVAMILALLANLTLLPVLLIKARVS
jgi:uncharacterized protein